MIPSDGIQLLSLVIVFVWRYRAVVVCPCISKLQTAHMVAASPSCCLSEPMYPWACDRGSHHQSAAVSTGGYGGALTVLWGFCSTDRWRMVSSLVEGPGFLGDVQIVVWDFRFMHWGRIFP